VDSVYWVVSRHCNQRCGHCYNDSQPGARGLSPEQVSRCVEQLPDPDDVAVDRIILSGGEVLAWPELLFHTLERLDDRYGARTALWVQTNGDLLDEPTLDRLLAHGVRRVDVSSMDSYHPKSTVERRDVLQRMFESRAMAAATEDAASDHGLHYGFWGATADQWIGPLWPRGRARLNGLSSAGPQHEFCRMWSGAKNFLEYRGRGCEVNVQLADVYPCCPMTCRPLGSLLDEPLTAMLDRCARHPVFRALNEGRPEKMGETLGIGEEYGVRRTRELGNHCLWCDEFFTTHATDLLYQNGMTTRGAVDLEVDPTSHVKRAATDVAPTRIATKPLS
jgi:organic radical activating enzyme